MSVITTEKLADQAIASDDAAAAKRVLSHIRSYLELLTADVADLTNALDGKPGEVTALAAKLLDNPEDLWRYTGPYDH
jgi:hypothetical protein